MEKVHLSTTRCVCAQPPCYRNWCSRQYGVSEPSMTFSHAELRTHTHNHTVTQRICTSPRVSCRFENSLTNENRTRYSLEFWGLLHCIISQLLHNAGRMNETTAIVGNPHLEIYFPSYFRPFHSKCRMQNFLWFPTYQSQARFYATATERSLIDWTPCTSASPSMHFPIFLSNRS
jgi:hypothetical protein